MKLKNIEFHETVNIEFHETGKNIEFHETEKHRVS